jgi:hypothetical protein
MGIYMTTEQETVNRSQEIVAGVNLDGPSAGSSLKHQLTIEAKKTRSPPKGYTIPFLKDR